MSDYQTVSYTTSGVKASLAINQSVAPIDITVALTLVAGSVSYKLQYSLDPADVADVDAVWFDSVDLPAGSNGSGVAAFSFPLNRVRLDIASLTTGPLTLQVLQASRN